MNYHRPVIGTYHPKYMVVDREIAVVCTNNIQVRLCSLVSSICLFSSFLIPVVLQDIDNLEMMCQFEGPIVDSIYDAALICWHKALVPQLPRITSPAAQGNFATFEEASFQALFNKDGSVVPIEPGTSHHSPRG